MAIKKKNLQELTDEELKDVNGGLHIDNVIAAGYTGTVWGTTMAMRSGQCPPGFKLDDAGNCVSETL